MKRLIPVLLALCLLLCACGSGNGDTAPTTAATEPTTVPTQAPTTEATAAPTTEATVPPTEGELLYTHPLTGEALAAPMTNRLFAASLGNTAKALPQHSIGQADILYEILAEGSATRLVAIYSDLRSIPQIGSIRSGRTYLLDLAYSYNAALAHCGTSVYADRFISNYDPPHMDAMFHGEFYRNQDRLSAGYDLEHTLFIGGQTLYDLYEANNYDITVAEDTTYGLNFAQEATPEGEAAATITIGFIAGKTTTANYDADTGLYTLYQYDQDMIDGNTGEKVAFKNVFVLHADTNVISGEGHRSAELTGSGEGYFACGGQIIPIQWHRDDYESCFTYTLADGTPLYQGIGASYIAVIPMEGTVSYE